VRKLFERQRKYIKNLQQSRSFRYEEQQCIIEGSKPIKDLLNSDHAPEYLVFNEKALGGSSKLNDFYEDSLKSIECLVTDKFDSLSEQEKPEGVLAVCTMPASLTNLETFITGKSRLLALFDINDPGNLGSIIRTSLWFNVDGILLIGDCVDPFSPKVTRSSMGTVFSMPLISFALVGRQDKEALHDWEIVSTFLGTPNTWQSSEPKEKRILLLGSESHGLDPHLKQFCTTNYLISRQGKGESLNLAAAAALAIRDVLV